MRPALLFCLLAMRSISAAASYYQWTCATLAQRTHCITTPFTTKIDHIVENPRVLWKPVVFTSTLTLLALKAWRSSQRKLEEELLMTTPRKYLDQKIKALEAELKRNKKEEKEHKQSLAYTIKSYFTVGAVAAATIFPYAPTYGFINGIRYITTPGCRVNTIRLMGILLYWKYTYNRLQAAENIHRDQKSVIFVSTIAGAATTCIFGFLICRTPVPLYRNS